MWLPLCAGPAQGRHLPLEAQAQPPGPGLTVPQDQFHFLIGVRVFLLPVLSLLQEVGQLLFGGREVIVPVLPCVLVVVVLLQLRLQQLVSVQVIEVIGVFVILIIVLLLLFLLLLEESTGPLEESARGLPTPPVGRELPAESGLRSGTDFRARGLIREAAVGM